MDSIGAILKQAREKQDSSLQAVYEATKITIPNLSALEEDRFDFFPNKVYARAFLRDYANYLGIDSSDLILRYETEWNAEPAAIPTDVIAPAPKSSGLKYAILITLLVAIIGGAIYFYLQNEDNLSGLPKSTGNIVEPQREEPLTTLPESNNIVPDKTQPALPKPVLTPPEPIAAPSVSNKLVLEVTATRNVWVRVNADGKRVFIGVINVGVTKKFEALKKIDIRSGMAGAVQLKLNGKPQPSLGSLKVPGDKEFTLPALPAAPKPTIKQ